MTYEQVLKDWQVLFEDIGMARDMTGGYVESEDLIKLLKSPSRATAKDCLKRQIKYWLEKGPDFNFINGGVKTYQEICEEYPIVRKIENRYAPSTAGFW